MSYIIKAYKSVGSYPGNQFIEVIGYVGIVFFLCISLVEFIVWDIGQLAVRAQLICLLAASLPLIWYKLKQQEEV